MRAAPDPGPGRPALRAIRPEAARDAAGLVDPPALTGPDGTVADLAALVRLCLASGSVRDILWLRLSRLPRGLDRPHHRRLLREALALPQHARRARVFHLPDGDMAVATAPPDTLRPAVLRVLDGAVEEAAIAEVVRGLRLPEEAGALLAGLEESLGLAPPTPPAGPALPPLEAEALAAVLPALTRADPAPYLRRQPVLRLTPEGESAVEAESIAPMPGALRDRLLPGRGLEAVPALAARLRLALELRMLAGVAWPEWLASPWPLHLSLSVASLTSEAFLALDGRLPGAVRPMLTLGVPAAEVLADPAGFALGRDLAASRGYALALEAPGGPALALLPPARIGAGMVRLAWSEALPADPGPVATLAGAGVAVVLTGADRSAAIAWGWENGITLFQGRATDRHLRR
ncbi:hypothetical protein [Roseomonas indoligenes]|uniref:EAL domain-containing protein n=1 Tax=Roseomonas indoligenes TaxID=2820811 RepID=A0A940S303_9PROT|nr:hypothetical protein [Pararoseomonas indoligenes]MBP0491711.1 hypothetical protein [Pararoseomonas indoligenes]